MDGPVHGFLCHCVIVRFTKFVPSNISSLGKKRSVKAVLSAWLVSLACLIGSINFARKASRVCFVVLLVSHVAVCNTHSMS